MGRRGKQESFTFLFVNLCVATVVVLLPSFKNMLLKLVNLKHSWVKRSGREKNLKSKLGPDFTRP